MGSPRQRFLGITFQDFHFRREVVAVHKEGLFLYLHCIYTWYRNTLKCENDLRRYKSVFPFHTGLMNNPGKVGKMASLNCIHDKANGIFDIRYFDRHFFTGNLQGRSLGE